MKEDFVTLRKITGYLYSNGHCIHSTTDGLIWCCRCKKAEIELEITNECEK